MKKILFFVGFLALAGCASKPVPVVTNVDKEPLLVGMPIGERVAGSTKKINEQLELLDKVEKKSYVGTYSMVTHNNELDARKGSSRTLPPEFSKASVQVKAPVKEEAPVAVKNDVEEKSAVVQSQEVVSTNPALKKTVKKIEWKNDSANNLGKQFATALGYEFSSTAGKDKKVYLLIENETLENALSKFRSALGSDAQLMIVDKNKTFNIVYK